MDLVSIVIPVYNTGEPLRGCLDSVIQQTYPNLEIVVVDDESTDQLTLDILKEYAAKDSRIKLVRNEKNGGLSFSRNAGVAQTTGKYLSFLDSDDKFVPNYVERMVNALEQNQTELVLCHVLNYADDPNVKFDPNELKLSLSEHPVVGMKDFIERGDLFNTPVIAYGKMMRLDVYKQKQMGFSPELRKWEDNDWFFRCVTQFQNFTVLDFVGIHRLVHSDSLSQDIDVKSIHFLFDMYNLVYQSFKNHGYIDRYYYRFMSFVLISFTYFAQHLKNKQEANCLSLECLDLLKKFGYSFPSDLSMIKREMFKTKLLYKVCKVFFNKQGYNSHKQRYIQYKDLYMFLKKFQ